VLISSQLRDTNFYNAVLTGGALELADFTRANMSNALLNGASLDFTQFIEARLGNARFTNAVLRDTNFSNARDVPAHLLLMIEQSGSLH